MRTLNSAAQALQVRRTAGENIPVVNLLYMGFAVVQRWAIAGVPLAWNSQTWTQRDIRLSNVQSEQGDFRQAQITLPGVTDAERALAFADVEGIAVQIYRAWVDPDTAVVADAIQVWAGEVDIPGWQARREAYVHFLAESRASIALRPRASRYTNDEQRRLYPGDTSLDFDPATDSAPVTWPAASYFRV